MPPRVKPNTVLPVNAYLLLPPVYKKIGSFVEMRYDAALHHCGITWFRVLGGLGNRNDREDWVADVPYTSPSVSDYNWNDESFGEKFSSIETAMIKAIKSSLGFARFKQKEILEQFEAQMKASTMAIKMLSASLDEAGVIER